jgi:hypothetical protein
MVVRATWVRRVNASETRTGRGSFAGLPQVLGSGGAVAIGGLDHCLAGTSVRRDPWTCAARFFCWRLASNRFDSGRVKPRWAISARSSGLSISTTQWSTPQCQRRFHQPQNPGHASAPPVKEQARKYPVDACTPKFATVPPIASEAFASVSPGGFVVQSAALRQVGLD